LTKHYTLEAVTARSIPVRYFAATPIYSLGWKKLHFTCLSLSQPSWFMTDSSYRLVSSVTWNSRFISHARLNKTKHERIWNDFQNVNHTMRCALVLKDALNWSKVKVKMFVMLHRKSCSFQVSFKESWKKSISFHKNIKQNNCFQHWW